jgi:hypothetical protein
MAEQTVVQELEEAERLVSAALVIASMANGYPLRRQACWAGQLLLDRANELTSSAGRTYRCFENPRFVFPICGCIQLFKVGQVNEGLHQDLAYMIEGSLAGVLAQIQRVLTREGVAFERTAILT